MPAFANARSRRGGHHYKTLGLLLGLAAAVVGVSGCISTYVVKEKAEPHLEFSLEDRQMREVEGKPGYYALLPVAIVGDVVTSPIQIVYFLLTDDSHTGSANIYGIPVPLP